MLGVRVEMPTNQPIVLLRERDGERYLPIWIGAAEATAIAYAQQGVVPPRPMTHDLLKNVIEALGHELVEVRIVELKDSIFHATLVFDGAVEVSARSSDAIALALRTGTSILVEDGLLDEAGVAIGTVALRPPTWLTEFLDHVSAEDFENPDATGPSTETWPTDRD